MERQLLAELLATAAKDAEALQPFLAKKLALFNAALDAATERKPTGGQTGRASQALQRLRNPLLNVTHANKARGVAAALVAEAGLALSKSLPSAMKDYVLLEQAKLELSLHEAGSNEHQSREDGPIENKKDVIRLHEAMAARRVPLYFLARLPEYKLDVIAELAIDGNQDRDHEEPGNRWLRMFANGELDSVRGSMTEDEARLLAEASARLEMPQNLALRDRLEERLGRTLDVTPAFAAALQRIVEEARELTAGEAHVMFFASGQRFSQQTEMLAKLLGLSANEKVQVEAFVSFVHKANRVLTGSIVDLRLGRIKDMLAGIVETFEDHKVPHAEWVPRIQASLLAEGGFIEVNLPDAETFWALLAAVLEESKTHELLQAIRARDQAEVEAELQRTQRAYLDRLGISYHIIENGHVIPGLPDEDDLGAQFFYRGDGVGEHFATPEPNLEGGENVTAMPSPTAPEQGAHESSDVRQALSIEVLPPRRAAGGGPDLFEGME